MWDSVVLLAVMLSYVMLCYAMQTIQLGIPTWAVVLCYVMFYCYAVLFCVNYPPSLGKRYSEGRGAVRCLPLGAGGSIGSWALGA